MPNQILEFIRAILDDPEQSYFQKWHGSKADSLNALQTQIAEKTRMLKAANDGLDQLKQKLDNKKLKIGKRRRQRFEHEFQVLVQQSDTETLELNKLQKEYEFRNKMLANLRDKYNSRGKALDVGRLTLAKEMALMGVNYCRGVAYDVIPDAFRAEFLKPLEEIERRLYVIYSGAVAKTKESEKKA
jgi:hypothetical protein